jgi:hypothetical protein
MYHVAVDDQIPYDIYTNMQDDSTMRGPSVAQNGGPWGIGEAQGWDYGMGGCESGFTLPDITDTNIVWASCYADEVTRWDAKTHQARSVSPWLHTLDSAPYQTKYRCHWTPPLAIDPFDHNVVYYGCQVVLKTSNGGQSWSVISPDLSAHDPKYIVSSGGLIGDNLGQFYGEVVFALAPSTIQKGLLWAGTNDGKVWYTPDGGGHWNDVTTNIGMKPMGTITSIQPSFFKPGTAYVSVDYHLEDDRDPHLYKTTDFGKTWTAIADNLPRGELAYVRNISEDPNCEGLLFVGTGEALYYTHDDGGHWTELNQGLPHSPVTWTVVQKRFHDLVVSTWGRGVYILDDITPLEQIAKEPTTADVRLFAPRQTYRLTRDPHAIITYALKKRPRGKVEIQIADSDGKVIRTLHEDGHAGINRVAWDMFYDDLVPVVLRTIPPQDPHIWEEARFKGKTFRPVTHWGMAAVVHGPLAAPGHYQVRLNVGGKTQTAPLDIVRDPGSETNEAGMQATLKLQLRIADDVHKIADMVNLAEEMRARLESLESSSARDSELKHAAAAMDAKIQNVEYQLMSRDLAPSDDKIYASAYKDYYNLLWLNAEIGTGAGDVAGGTDFGPTDTEATLLTMIETQTAKDTTAFQAVINSALPDFNRMLEAKHIAPLDTTLKPLPDLRKAYSRELIESADDD